MVGFKFHHYIDGLGVLALVVLVRARFSTQVVEPPAGPGLFGTRSTQPVVVVVVHRTELVQHIRLHRIA